MKLTGAAAALFGVFVAPGVATAQALSCAVPAIVARPRPDMPDARQPRRLLPTASYTLALSWSPQFCRERAGRSSGAADSNAQQYGGGNAFGFTLHGLWPDGAGRDWPQYCRPVELLSDATLRANLCATPSVQLLQHEWAKHGSCMAGGANAYFDRARALYVRLRFPDMATLSRRPQTGASLAAAFARANPGLTIGAMRVRATRDGWLDEVWLCLDRNFRSVRCPAHKTGASNAAPLRIWRGRSA